MTAHQESKSNDEIVRLATKGWELGRIGNEPLDEATEKSESADGSRVIARDGRNVMVLKFTPPKWQ
jgi:hypothetical protein